MCLSPENMQILDDVMKPSVVNKDLQVTPGDLHKLLISHFICKTEKSTYTQVLDTGFLTWLSCP